MPAIHYLSDHQREQTKKKFRPIIEDMAQNQTLILISLLLDGMDIESAVDHANAIPKTRYK